MVKGDLDTGTTKSKAKMPSSVVKRPTKVSFMQFSNGDDSTSVDDNFQSLDLTF